MRLPASALPRHGEGKVSSPFEARARLSARSPRVKRSVRVARQGWAAVATCVFSSTDYGGVLSVPTAFVLSRTGLRPARSLLRAQSGQQGELCMLLYPWGSAWRAGLDTRLWVVPNDLAVCTP
jgi:hypothetical protein